MKSVKISEKANKKVVGLSEMFHMSKQSFVSLVLENVDRHDVMKLLKRELDENNYETVYHNGYTKMGTKMMEGQECDDEDGEEEDTIEFEDEEDENEE